MTLLLLGINRCFNLTDWPTYKLLLKERFDEIWDDPIAELKQLQETEGIVEYQTKFESNRTRVNLPEAYLVSAYLAGLRVDRQMHIRMFLPQTVMQCLLLGRLYETAHPRKNLATSWNPLSLIHYPKACYLSRETHRYICQNLCY